MQVSAFTEQFSGSSNPKQMVTEVMLVVSHSVAHVPPL